MITLGIESSCDDTAAAVLDRDSVLLASVVYSQDIIHRRFGGVVPELASRRHMEAITSVVDEALQRSGVTFDELELICVTQGPGLIGSLLVGFSYAKALSYRLDIPFVGVDHMAGHLLSAYLEPVKPDFPYIALIVSGGTTALYKVESFVDFTLLGATRDDAAGEAFDKIARYLELGYPGGPCISERAKDGDSTTVKLPRAWLEEGSTDFSFSGLKTAVLNHCNRLKQQGEVLETAVNDVCASFQQAVIDVLIAKTIATSRSQQIDTIVIGGGVCANTSLRKQMAQQCREQGLALHLPAIENCTDNAAMIAFAGLKQFERGIIGSIRDDVFSRSRLGR
ncbi:MAG: tRNA (adenosine(37)-N6)-threonylcarbamoyltransferase complex transferase subunit TsaD [Desulfocapsaceae bacterium]